MSRALMVAVMLCAVVGAFVAWFWEQEMAPRPAPRIAFSIVDGSRIELTKLRGQPVLVTFWATTCPACLKEMPHLAALYERLNGEGLELVGVAMPYDQPAQVLRLIEHKKLPYPVALDPLGEAVIAFGDVRVTPTTFLISPNGDIVLRETGPLPIDAIEKRIRSMLRKS